MKVLSKTLKKFDYCQIIYMWQNIFPQNISSNIFLKKEETLRESSGFLKNKYVDKIIDLKSDYSLFGSFLTFA